MQEVFVSVYAGVGRDNPAEFAEQVSRMLQVYCARSGWRVDPFQIRTSESGGMDSVEFFVLGDGAYDRLVEERGIHRRLRRINGELQTSMASVYVLEVATGEDLDLDQLQIETLRESAPYDGAMAVISSVRIVHEPTGMIVECQGRGTSEQLRTRALTVLATKLAVRSHSTEIETLPGSVRRRYDLSRGIVRDENWETSSPEVERVLKGQLELIEPPELGPDSAHKRYRPNVGAILRRGDLILLCQRVDPPYHWQLPQGGIDPGESVEETLWRELGEELGLERPRELCRLVAHGPAIRYDFPDDDTRPVARYYAGQEQTLYVLDFLGDDEDIDLERGDVVPEFRDLAWLSVDDALARFWAFKRPVLERTVEVLEHLFARQRRDP